MTQRLARSPRRYEIGDFVATFAPDLPAADIDARIAKIDKVHGRRATFRHRPATPATRYCDAAKPRALDVIGRDLRKVIDRINKRLTEPELARITGVVTRRRQMLPGWHVVATDGHAAICRRGPGTGAPLLTRPTAVAGMPADAWRDYAVARTCRDRVDPFITWTLGDDQLVWHARSAEAGTEGRAWCAADSRQPGPPAVLRLNDIYTWPLRGASWRIGCATNGQFPAATFTAPDDHLLIVIAGAFVEAQ